MRRGRLSEKWGIGVTTNSCGRVRACAPHIRESLRAIPPLHTDGKRDFTPKSGKGPGLKIVGVACACVGPEPVRGTTLIASARMCL